ncbi:MAG: acetyl-CoA carboxylase biotin carboxyl carrier protein subunit [Crocinitomix sp.]|nr:acetyl-CoA carboxylase biotin carboxyl carrier protein subunit [Crocinitomix sp.]
MQTTVYTAQLEKQLRNYEVEELSEGIYRLHEPGQIAVIIEVLAIDFDLKSMKIRNNHTIYELEFKNDLDLVLDKMGIKRSVETLNTDIKAPMPGKVIAILVGPNDQVKKGDGILILEAMKMENVLKASADCTIKTIHISTGVNVEKGQLLVELA